MTARRTHYRTEKTIVTYHPYHLVYGDFYPERVYSHVNLGRNQAPTGHFFIKNILLFIHKGHIFGNILNVHFGMEMVSRENQYI